MAVIDDFGDNRPPPKQKRSLNITQHPASPGIGIFVYYVLLHKLFS